MRRVLANPYTKGAIGALGGGVIGLLAYHLWTDHLTLHAILAFLEQHEDLIRRLAPPTAP